MSFTPQAQLRERVIGHVLMDRYEITDFIGSGGFADVFEGFDRLIKRTVAIKILDLHRLAAARHTINVSAFSERFNREATLAARIRHPNVVTIHDMGVTKDEGLPFIVMERLRGHDLHKELKSSGAMAPHRTLTLFKRALDALDVAHRMGIVHKDLKPSNLFLDNPGTEEEDIRIVDFGIARLGDESAILTGTGQISGTARYLAPEYIKHQTVSPTLDVYQMGLILVEMLSGRPVVEEDNAMACAYKHGSGELDIPIPLLDSPLGPIIARAVALNPDERYQDAAALRKALDPIDPRAIPALAGAYTSIPLKDTSSNHYTAVSPEVDDTGPLVVLNIPAPIKVDLSAVEHDLDPTNATEISDLTPAPRLTAPRTQKALPLVLLAAAAGFLALIAVGALLVMLLDSTTTKPASKPLQSASKAPLAPSKKAVEAPVPEPEPEITIVPATITVTLDTAPSGATVLENDNEVGTTPFEAVFDNLESPERIFVLQLPKHRPMTVQLAATDAPAMTFKFKAKKAKKGKAGTSKPRSAGDDLIAP